MYDWLSLQVSSNYQFGLAYLNFLAMGEVLSFEFNLAVLDPSDRKETTRIVLFPLRIKRWGLYHIA